MVQRYGGKYSPQSPNNDAARGDDGRTHPNRTGLGERPHPFEGQIPDISAARPNFLFLTAVPLLFTAFGEGALGMALDLMAFFVLISGFYTLREGLKAEMAYNTRTLARRPAFPRKILSAALTALGAGLAAWDPMVAEVGRGVSAIVLGLLAGALHLTAFGLDPMRNKTAEGVDDLSAGRVAEAIDRAEVHLAAMAEAIATVGDRDLQSRVARFCGTARRMFRRVEEDPRDLRGVRRFLGVYLLGAREASEKFADLYARDPNEEDRARYVALLNDLQGRIAEQTEQLLLDDRADLDVEIEVLRERLQRETGG
jgi:hypothetical protein